MFVQNENIYLRCDSVRETYIPDCKSQVIDSKNDSEMFPKMNHSDIFYV